MASAHLATPALDAYATESMPADQRDGRRIDDDALTTVPIETEALGMFAAEQRDAAADVVGHRALHLPRIDRRPWVNWRTTSMHAAGLAALVLLLMAFWPQDRMLLTSTDRERLWTPFAAPVDPELVTSNPSAARDIQRTLYRYRDAMGILDVEAIRTVWPSADARALADRFEAVYDQNLEYHACRIVVRSISATAVCRSTFTVVGNVRPRRRSSRTSEWHFWLRKQSTAWVITRVNVPEGASNGRHDAGSSY